MYGDVAVPDFDVSLPDVSGLRNVSEADYLSSLPNAVSLGEKNALLDAARTAQTARSQAMQTSNEMQRLIDYLSGGEQVSFVPFGRNAGLPFGSFEDGGLIEYQYGGGVSGIQEILNEAGMSASPEQLALFEQFDPTSLNTLAQSLQGSLLSGTQQAQQQQAGMGFAGSGAIQRAQEQQRESAMGQLESAQEQAARDFESQTLGQAARMIEGDAVFEEFGSSNSSLPNTVSTLPTSNQGTVIYNGVQYIWDQASNQYVTAQSIVGGAGVGGTGGTGTGSSGTGSSGTGSSGTGSSGYMGTGLSDIKLKKDIKHIGISKKGINIYEFKYKNPSHGKGLYKGVMAQEVPWASVKMDNGYLAVDYSKLDVDFERVM